MSSSEALNYFSFCVFGGSILLIVYIVYYEWKRVLIKAQKDERELGEIENEDKIKNLNPDQLVELVNDDSSSGSTKGGPDPKKPTS